MNYSPAGVYNKSNSFLGQLITLVAWVGLVACIIELYFLIGEGKDFLRGWAGVVHYDTGWNKLIQFYGGLGVLCFGIATGIGLKFIAAILVGLYLVSAMGSTFYVKTMKAPSALPVVQGASVGNSRQAPRAQPVATEYPNYNRASFGKNSDLHANTRLNQHWKAEALKKNMKIVRNLKAHEITWCKTTPNLDKPNQRNCYTGKKWRH